MGFRPVNASIGDALSVDQGLAGEEFLGAGYQIALHHDADNVWVPFGNLAGDVVAYNRLAAVVLVAVGVAEVDHDARLDAGLFHLPGGLGHALRRVVHRPAAAAQDDVAIGIAGGDEDGGLAVFGVAQEGVGMSGGQDRIDGDLHVAGGGILEAHRA